MRPRFTSAVVRGLLVLAEQAQAEEGRTAPDRRAPDQRDRDRALEYLTATAEHRGIEWKPPAPVAQIEADVRSRDDPPDPPVKERRKNAFPQVGSVWEETGGTMRYLVRSVMLTRTFGMDPPVTAVVVLRCPGGASKTVTPAEWRRMARNLQEVQKVDR